MLGKLRLKLESNQPLNTNMSSLFHGILMEHISHDYAEFLHESIQKPFRSSLLREGDYFIWELTTLSKEAYTHIIEKMLTVEKLEVKHKNILVNITEKSLSTVPFDSILQKAFHNEYKNKNIDIEFLSPTAFKQFGNYTNIPTPRLLFQNILKKLSQINEELVFMDENTLDDIDKTCSISRFNIRSAVFNVEGVKIPAFVGKIRINVNGPKELVSLCNLALDFGEFSGIGIKTSLGMGAIRRGDEGIWKNRVY